METRSELDGQALGYFCYEEETTRRGAGSGEFHIDLQYSPGFRRLGGFSCSNNGLSFTPRALAMCHSVTIVEFRWYDFPTTESQDD